MTATAFAHTRQNGARHGEQAEDVGFELIANFPVVGFLDGRLIAIAGIVDENVDVAEALQRGRHGRLDLGGIRDVEIDGERVTLVSGDEIGYARLVAGSDDCRPASGNGE